MIVLKTLIFLLVNVADFGSSYNGVAFYKTDSHNFALWTSSDTPATYYSTHSVTDCARRCLEQEACSVMTFEPNNRTCTLGERINAQPVSQSPSGDLYQTSPPPCNSAPGFNLTAYGNESTCLWWSDSMKNFTEARQDSKGSILATFKTSETFSIVNQTKYITVYIGLDDIEVEGEFRWHDDGSVLFSNSSYVKQFFREGEPNNQNLSGTTDEDCVAFWEKGLKDCPCWHLNHFVCEKKCFSL